MTKVLFAERLETVADEGRNRGNTEMKHQIITLSAAAADPFRVRLVDRVIKTARSLGVTLTTDAPIDPYKLSADLKAAGASIEDRFALKTNLAELGCL